MSSFQEFNEFQKNFYTNHEKFSRYTNFEIKKHGFILVHNISKYYPNLSNIILKLGGFNWYGYTSKSILIALQKTKFQNLKYVPAFVYFKAPTSKKETKETKTKTKTRTKKSEKLIKPDDNIIFEIKSILMIDSKTYALLENTEIVQNLARKLIEK